jgi:6-pyruvoyltetrahydropterin/6-carboxytetrahydropterin synthase
LELVQLERRYRFSASHLYRRSEWTEAQNRERFGKCANLPGHGHNYRLFVTVEGVADEETGFIVDLGWLDALLRERVLEPLDHQHLNVAVEEFAESRLIPSSENLVFWISRRLSSSFPEGVRLAKLRLEEDEDLAAEWTP